jgi:hypothetical protein
MLRMFYAFQDHVECLLYAKIKFVQSDWGGEYHKLHRYLQRTGISHRVSCPHTSQQNGIAERKHRHIIETSLALLRVISLTAYPHRSFKRTHRCIAFSVSNLTMIFSKILAMCVGLVFSSIMLINLRFGLTSVSF